MKKTLSLILCLLLTLSGFGFTAADVDLNTVADETETILIGDVDLNGHVESIDAAYLMRFIVRIIDPLPSEITADANLDGSPDIVDATMIQRYLADIFFSYSCFINIPDYVAYEGKRTADTVASHQNRDTVSFTAFTDAHYSDNAQSIVDGITHAGMGMNIVTSVTHQDFGAVLGDNGWQSSDVSLEEGISQIKACNALIDYSLDRIPNLRVPGNHCSQIGAFYANRDYHRNADLFPYYGAYNTDAVFDGENRRRGYCYQDFTEHKLRVICLNTSDLEAIKPADYESHNISSAQLKWLCRVLDISDKADPEEWQILVISHAPLDWSDRTIPAAGILHAYKSGTAYSVSKDGETVACNYSGTRRGRIIAQVHGHIHDYKVDDLRYLDENDNTALTGIKRIAVPNACNGRDNEYKHIAHEYLDINFADAVSYHKTVGTGKDTAFTAFTIDLASHTIYADCYGAGIDRIINY